MINRRKYRKGLMIVTAFIVLFGGVGIVTKVIHDMNEGFVDEPVAKVEENNTDVKTPKEEVFLSPVNESIGIVRYFYDKDSDSAKQEQSLIFFENVYRPNQGVDYASNGTPFDVIAAMSGTVTKKTNDPVLGWVVSITNDNGVVTNYESLNDVNVQLKGTVKQGDIIGKSGECIYEADLKNHIHFSIEKNGVLYNPEKYISKGINTIK